MPLKRTKTKPRPKANLYEIIHRAVEAGLQYGYRRAFKYSDGPDAEHIRTVALDAIMLELSEVLDFGDGK